MSRNSISNKQNKNKNKRFRSFGSTSPNALYSEALPRQMKIMLRYASNITIVTTNGLAYDHQYNLNSIHDPDRTGTGHQPLAHDQWANLYNRYRVDGARVTVTWLNSSTLGQTCTILGSNSTTAITATELAAESPVSLSRGMSQYQNSVVLRKYFNLANVTGVTREVYNADDRFESAFGASPTEAIILHVVTDTPTSVTLYLNINIEYYCTLFDAHQIFTS